MMLIAPVLHDLEPVARQHMADDLPKCSCSQRSSRGKGNGFRPK